MLNSILMTKPLDGDMASRCRSIFVSAKDDSFLHRRHHDMSLFMRSQEEGIVPRALDVVDQVTFRH